MIYNYSRKFRCVYSLIDPRSGNVFYIGQTCMPEQRLQEHLIDAEVSLEMKSEYGESFEIKPKAQYIINLWKEDGRDPTMKILAEGQYTYSEICKIETETIKEYSGRGVLLTNRSLTKRAADLLPCGHPKSSLIQLRFGSRPYCEDCKRATIR